ncbi:MAG: hypothetical protein M5U34_25465 [Chloroflexi bacterium]|nr:hypothetical protein [Chloroflexota bacterium]
MPYLIINSHTGKTHCPHAQMDANGGGHFHDKGGMLGLEYSFGLFLQFDGRFRGAHMDDSQSFKGLNACTISMVWARARVRVRILATTEMSSAWIIMTGLMRSRVP